MLTPDTCSTLLSNTAFLTVHRPASALPLLNHSALVINGPGANNLTVRRSAASAFRIFNIAAGSVVTLNGLTLSNGRVPNLGGGVMATSAGNKTVAGAALRAPQTEPGGKNATLEIPLAAPLQPGQTVSVEFRLGVQRGGYYRFYARIEAQAP